MTDVFISYSRRDKVFTQKLVDALQAAEREVWADWASIPAASDWDAEIKEGIEKTNTVLFVLSPEWITSNECRKEMDHAVKMGKRLVPILHIMPAEGQAVPPELAKLNWVYMRESDDFDKAFQTLLGAMDTDLDWIKTHTRIQIRALEWDKKKRSASFALRGEDLTEGEQFIASGANKSPAPTQLQSEYILASRKDATRRQRQTLAGVTVALVVSIALSIYAVIQQRKAETQAQIALARQLASQAQVLLNNDDSKQMIASLLSIQSLKLFPNTDASSFLINHNFSTKTLTGIEAGPVDLLVFSPNDQFLVSAGCDEVDKDCVHMWDAKTGEEAVHIDNNQKQIWDIVFNQDGEQFFTVGCDKLDENSSCIESSIRIYASDTGHEIDYIVTNVNDQVEFGPDRKFITMFRQESIGDEYVAIVRTWDVTTKKDVIRQFPLSCLLPNISPDGKYIICLEGSVWSVETGENIFNIDAESVHLGIISEDGRYAAYGSVGDISVWDITAKKEIFHSNYKMVGSFVVTPDPFFSPDGKYIMAAGSLFVTRIWETATGNEVARLPLPSRSISFSSDSQYFLADSGNVAIVRETSTGKEVARMTHNGVVTAVVFSDDGQYIASASEDKTILIWKASAGITRLPFDWDPWISTNSNVNFMVGQETVSPFQTNTSESLNSLVAFSPDSKYSVSGGSFTDNTTYVREITSGKEVAYLNYGLGLSVFSVFSLDGKYIITFGDDNIVTIWPWQSKDIIANACEYLPRNLTHTEWTQYIGDAMPYPTKQEDATCPNLPIEPEIISTPTVTP